MKDVEATAPQTAQSRAAILVEIACIPELNPVEGSHGYRNLMKCPQYGPGVEVVIGDHWYAAFLVARGNRIGQRRNEDAILSLPVPTLSASGICADTPHENGQQHDCQDGSKRSPAWRRFIEMCLVQHNLSSIKAISTGNPCF